MLSKNLTDKIKACLEQYEKVRDSDQYLLAMIWRDEIGESAHSESCFSLLGVIARGEVTHFESIRRTRQKLQEEIPSLRGKNWDKRHKKAKNFPEQELKPIEMNIQQPRKTKKRKSDNSQRDIFYT